MKNNTLDLTETHRSAYLFLNSANRLWYYIQFPKDSFRTVMLLTLFNKYKYIIFISSLGNKYKAKIKNICKRGWTYENNDVISIEVCEVEGGGE